MNPERADLLLEAGEDDQASFMAGRIDDPLGFDVEHMDLADRPGTRP